MGAFIYITSFFLVLIGVLAGRIRPEISPLNKSSNIAFWIVLIITPLVNTFFAGCLVWGWFSNGRKRTNQG